MAVFAVYIEKSVEYGGSAQVFGNTYHFLTDTAEPFDDALAAQQVAEAERDVTANVITFTRWQSWGPTDGAQIDNVMRESGELSGTGAAAVTTPFYREVCSLTVWPLARSVATNRRRWLRKFLRGAFGPQSPDGNVITGEDPLSQAERDAFDAAYTVPVTDLGALGNFQLCTESGDTPTGQGLIRPYLITRQIGR